MPVDDRPDARFVDSVFADAMKNSPTTGEGGAFREYLYRVRRLTTVTSSPPFDQWARGLNRAELADLYYKFSKERELAKSGPPKDVFERALSPITPEDFEFRAYLLDRWMGIFGGDSPISTPPFDAWVRSISIHGRTHMLSEYERVAKQASPLPDAASRAEQLSVDELFEKCSARVRPDLPLAGEFYDFLSQEYGRQGRILVPFEAWVAFCSRDDRLRIYKEFTNRPTGRRGDGASPPTLAEKLAKIDRKNNTMPINYERYNVKDPREEARQKVAARGTAGAGIVEKVAARGAARVPQTYQEYAATEMGAFVTEFTRRFLSAPFSTATLQSPKYHAYVDRLLASLYERWVKTPFHGFLRYVVDQYQRAFESAKRYGDERLAGACVGIPKPPGEVGPLVHILALRLLLGRPIDFDVSWAGELVAPFKIADKNDDDDEDDGEGERLSWRRPCQWWARAVLVATEDNAPEVARRIASLLGFPEDTEAYFMATLGGVPGKERDTPDSLPNGWLETEDVSLFDAVPEESRVPQAQNPGDVQTRASLDAYFREGFPDVIYPSSGPKMASDGSSTAGDFVKQIAEAVREKLGGEGDVLVVNGGSVSWVGFPGGREENEEPPETTRGEAWERDEMGFALRMGATEALSSQIAARLGLPSGELPRAFGLLVLGSVFSLAASSGLTEGRPVLKKAIEELTPSLNVWAAALGTSSAVRIVAEALEDPKVAPEIERFRIAVDEVAGSAVPSEPQEEPGVQALRASRG